MKYKTLKIPPELHREFKTYSSEKGESILVVTERAIKNEMKSKVVKKQKA